MASMAGFAILSAVALQLNLAVAFPQAPASVPGLPSTLSWQNSPAAWQFDSDNKVLRKSAGSKTDWFLDLFDGTVAPS
jgi:hypothetical protein